MSLLPCAFVWLLPTRVNVSKVQLCLNYIRLFDAKNPPTPLEKLSEEFSKLDAPHAEAFKIVDPAKVPEIIETKENETSAEN